MSSRFVTFKFTWATALPVLLAAYENGSAEGRAKALAELQRLAKVADAFVEQSEKGSEQ